MAAGLGIKVRIGFCSLIYRKILKLNQSHLDDISVGKILTLLTKDVQVLEVFVGVGSEIWTSVIKTVLIAALLYNRMGAAAVIGVLFVVVTVPLQSQFNFENCPR
jgi:ATP-binding cassette subfamily C (CFTR/MRP) protein 4